MSDRRPGFTLLELLIAVAIFTGVVILAMGAFARTISSSVQVAEARSKAEAVRSIIDQITNDSRFIASQEQIDSLKNTRGELPQGLPEEGIEVTRNRVTLLLYYPDIVPAGAESTFVYRSYRVIIEGGRSTIQLTEQRNCTLRSCDLRDLEPVEVLDPEFSLVTQGAPHVFSAVRIDYGLIDAGALRKRFTVNLTIARAQDGIANLGACDGNCYGLRTTVLVGGLR